MNATADSMESAGMATETGRAVAMESAMAASKVSFMEDIMGHYRRSVKTFFDFFLRGENWGFAGVFRFFVNNWRLAFENFWRG